MQLPLERRISVHQHLPFAFRQLQLLRLLIAAEDHQQLRPFAVFSPVVQAYRHRITAQIFCPQYPLLGIYGFILQAGALQPQGDQSPVIVYHLPVLPCPLPIQLIHFRAGAVAVFDTALSSAEFLAG